MKMLLNKNMEQLSSLFPISLSTYQTSQKSDLKKMSIEVLKQQKQKVSSTQLNLSYLK